jgi:hypothetical protein
MDQLFANVGWAGVIVGALVAFLAGWLWYSPMLFGKGWAKDLGVELGTAAQMPVPAMVSQAAGLLLLSLLADRLQAVPFVFALAIVGVMVLNFSGYLFGKRGMHANWTDVGYLAAVGIILGVVNALLQS